ncbi:serine/threonine-protein kinase VRK1 [Cimex lectularius]|uniref:non-specific serine/threonine protein kinase n=1 Tax=Cimex lectularius TaxID=79782 RepID=A0A8I6RWT0_CIMLE|nr:serine/threonine-protein kinase VRK1 [Cimex lectularius]
MVKAEKAASAVKAKPRKANGYKFPEKLPEGQILKDVMKKEWILGPSIGKGGFGEIYCAARYENGKFDKSYPFVVKIEPHENGPLFMEKNFYIKVAKLENVEEWKAKEKIKVLGIPTYYASGSHVFKDEKYRFLIIERYGNDLWNLFLKNKRFLPETVFKCALQIIDVLEFIHSRDYIHGDIKGANLLLGLQKGTENNVFLVDFGLACKYSTKEFKRDPKQEHNGTIEYTSCDWHLGVPTRRGDMEILGYNLLHWIASSLPWENDIKNKEKVHEKKQQLMKDVSNYFKKHFPNVPTVISKYMEYISKLKYDEAPDYHFCKNLFTTELKKMSCPIGSKLDFSAIKNTPKKIPSTPKKVATPRSGKKRKTPTKEINEVSDADPEEIQPKRTRRTPKRNGVVPEEDKEEEEIKSETTAKLEPKATKPTRRVRRKIEKVAILSDDEDDEIIARTPEEPKKTVKKTKNQKKEVDKVSWRDAPTVAGNINNKAGEYIKKTTLSRRKP